MARKILLLMLVTGMLEVVSICGAAVSPEDYRARRPIILSDMSSSRLVFLPLDEDAVSVDIFTIYKIITQDNEEVPYKMVLEQGEPEVHVLGDLVTARGRTENKQAFVVLDLGQRSPFVNRVDLQLQGASFRCHTRVEVSEDRETWLLLGEDLVYRLAEGGEDTSLDIPAHHQRYLRITLRADGDYLPQIEGCAAIHTIHSGIEYVAVDSRLRQWEDRTRSETVLQFDFNHQIADLRKVVFHLEDSVVDAEVALEAEGYDGELERVATLPLRKVSREYEASIAFRLIDPTSRLRLIIRSESAEPLQIHDAVVFRIQRGLVFPASPDKKYYLLYDTGRAPWPDYELQTSPLPVPVQEMPQVRLGPQGKLRTRAKSTSWVKENATPLIALALILIAAYLLFARRPKHRSEETKKGNEA